MTECSAPVDPTAAPLEPVRVALRLVAASNTPSRSATPTRTSRIRTRIVRHERSGLWVVSKDLDAPGGSPSSRGRMVVRDATPRPDREPAPQEPEHNDFCPYGPVWQTYSGCLLVVTPAVGGSFRTVGPLELQTTR